jgi:hypothetical protein
MARRDGWSAAGLGLLGVAYLLAAREYPLDTLSAPGPGVFPLAAGLALVALAAWQFATAGRTPPLRPSAGPAGWTRPVLVMAATLVAYAAALPRLGFLPTSFALVFVAARLMGLTGWWRPAALALGVTGASRVIFVTWLGVPLP